MKTIVWATLFSVLMIVGGISISSDVDAVADSDFKMGGNGYQCLAGV